MRVMLFVLVGGLVGCGSKSETPPDGTVPDGMVPNIEFSFTDLPFDGEPSQATSFRFIPGSSEFLVLTRPGKVLHFALDTIAATTTLLGEFSPPGVHVETDCGLLSLAFHPEYATNHYLYLGHCVSRFESSIRRFVFDHEDPDYEEVPQSMVEVIRLGDLSAVRAWHNVGALGFDADGHMFAFFGDKRIDENGQDRSNDLGAMLRVDPKMGIDQPGFDTVTENPFVGDPSGSDNIYAYGLRSPWQGFVDSKGRYWVGDVGSNKFEEVNVITEPGQNFGWADHEGRCKKNCDGITDPVALWDREDDHPYVEADPEARFNAPRVAWVGLEYTEHEDDPYFGALTGKVLFGDMCIGFVRALEVDDATAVVSDEHVAHLQNATGWDVGPDGHVYAVTFSDRCTTPSEEYPPSRFVRLDANEVLE